MKKILILSHKRFGKDTLAEFFNEMYGLTYTSSSEIANEMFIFDTIKDEFNYKDKAECFEDRVNHRDLWYDLICDFNSDDKSRLAKIIVDKVDCYVGMRDYDEFKKSYAEKLFDLIIWVDASERLPEEVGSFNIPKRCADIIIDNNGTLEEFREKAFRLGENIFKKEKAI